MTIHEDRLDRILESLSRIQVTIESLRISLQSISETSHDHEVRLRSVERWKHQLTPVLAVVTFVLGVVVTAVLERLM
jgi:hypothetical protein